MRSHTQRLMVCAASFAALCMGLAGCGSNTASTETAKTPESWNEFYGGQDVMKEFATANDNMVAFNYMPGYSAVSAAMQEAADKAADGSGKVADVFPVAQQTSIDTLKNYGLSVAK